MLVESSPVPSAPSRDTTRHSVLPEPNARAAVLAHHVRECHVILHQGTGMQPYSTLTACDSLVRIFHTPPIHVSGPAVVELIHCEPFARDPHQSSLPPYVMVDSVDYCVAYTHNICHHLGCLPLPYPICEILRLYRSRTSPNDLLALLTPPRLYSSHSLVNLSFHRLLLYISSTASARRTVEGRVTQPSPSAFPINRSTPHKPSAGDRLLSRSDSHIAASSRASVVHLSRRSRAGSGLAESTNRLGSLRLSHLLMEGLEKYKKGDHVRPEAVSFLFLPYHSSSSVLRLALSSKHLQPLLPRYTKP